MALVQQTGAAFLGGITVCRAHFDDYSRWQTSDYSHDYSANHHNYL
jgi:hypothetical protein